MCSLTFHGDRGSAFSSSQLRRSFKAVTNGNIWQPVVVQYDRCNGHYGGQAAAAAAQVHSHPLAWRNPSQIYLARLRLSAVLVPCSVLQCRGTCMKNFRFRTLSISSAISWLQRGWQDLPLSNRCICEAGCNACPFHGPVGIAPSTQDSIGRNSKSRALEKDLGMLESMACLKRHLTSVGNLAQFIKVAKFSIANLVNSQTGSSQSHQQSWCRLQMAASSPTAICAVPHEWWSKGIFTKTSAQDMRLSIWQTSNACRKCCRTPFFSPCHQRLGHWPWHSFSP